MFHTCDVKELESTTQAVDVSKVAFIHFTEKSRNHPVIRVNWCRRVVRPVMTVRGHATSLMGTTRTMGHVQSALTLDPRSLEGKLTDTCHFVNR